MIATSASVRAVTSVDLRVQMSTAWLVTVGVAAAVVLAFVGAPQSLDMIFLVGPDSPKMVGGQLAAAAAGAVATAVAILLDRYWPWLLAVGSVGVLVAHVFRSPAPGQALITVRVPGGNTPAPALPVSPAWAAVVLACAGLLVVGLLAVARELLRTSRLGASLAGLAGCAGYFGASVVGRLRGAEPVVRIVVLGVAAGLIVLVVARLLGPRGKPDAPDPEQGDASDVTTSLEPPDPVRRLRIGAAVAVLFPVLPTVLTAFTGEWVFGTVAGGLAGLVVLGVALVASAPAGVPGVVAVAACSLVLAAPVVILFLIYDVVGGQVWYAWPVALGGVLLGAAVAARRGPVAAVLVAAAALPMIALAERLGGDRRTLAELVIWSFLLLTMAAVAATVGTAAGTPALRDGLPALGGLVTAGAVGVEGSLSLLWASSNGRADLAKVAGPAGQWVAVVLMVAAAALLFLLVRFERAVSHQPVQR